VVGTFTSLVLGESTTNTFGTAGVLTAVAAQKDVETGFHNV